MLIMHIIIYKGPLHVGFLEKNDYLCTTKNMFLKNILLINENKFSPIL